MHQLPVTLIALIACCSHAAAQTRDNRTVDAIATLAPPTPILSVDGTGSLTFGRIKAPDVTVAACEYRIDYHGNMQVMADGVRSFGGVCEAEESWNLGIVAIGCEVDHRVTFSYTTQSLENARGVTFSVDEDQIGFVGEGLHKGALCGTNNDAHLIIGGTLNVARGTTVPEQQIVVGRVIIDIFYEAPCLCA